MNIFVVIMVPFIGTILGSMLVFIMKKELNRKLEVLIYGFAAGVMMAALIWSLIIPSLEYGSIIPVIIGLILGVLFFFIIDYVLDKRLNFQSDRSNLMVAITLHNIPEGMAVGVAVASYLAGGLSFSSCLALAIGIAIQNFPEGSVVSFPLLKKGYSKKKAFLYGFFSGVFELLGTIITLLFTKIVVVIMPYMLAIAAGAMMYVIVIELVPESVHKSRFNVIGFLIGFILMMILDVML